MLSLTAKTQPGKGNPPVVGFPEVERLLSIRNDTVYILNFWATWCVPCVKELPAFQQLHEKYADRNFRMILLSLDFRKDYHSRLLPFLQEKQLKPEVWLLYEPDANSWIPKVDEKWTGSIPATLILHRGERLFFEAQLSYDELESVVKPYLKKL